MAVVVVANFKVVTFLTTLGTVLFFSDDNFNVLSPNGSSWIICSLVMKSRKWSSCEAEIYILDTLLQNNYLFCNRVHESHT